MLRTALTAVGSLLRKPLFGTTVIPRDATVDPGLFPEDEYPIHCRTCDYCLRGLPDGKCPECGTIFERGLLLITTYGFGQRRAYWRKSAARKWFWVCLVAGIAIVQLPALAVTCLSYFGYFDSGNARSLAVWPYLLRIRLIVWSVISTSVLFSLTALVIAVKALPRGWRKRRRAIIDAIKQANPEKEPGVARSPQ